jgi:hypothetical protein
MGLLAQFAKGVKSAYYAVKAPVPKTGAVGNAIGSLVKKMGAAAGVVGTYTAADLVAGQMSKALTGPAGFSLPALSLGGGLSAMQSRAGGTIASAMPDVLDTSALKTYYRAPRGYVIVRDPGTGAVVAVRKAIARAYHLWKPARKPPISASDWHHYQRNQALEKKLLRIAAPALRHKHKTTAVRGGGKGKR